MCGRFYYTPTRVEEVLSFFEIFKEFGIRDSLSGEVHLETLPHFNISPFQHVPILASKFNSLHAQLGFWDLVPSFLKRNELKTKYKMINLQAENVSDPSKRYWNRLLARQRCLIPVEGFYEWHKPAAKKNQKIPYAIRLKGRKRFFLAGLWDRFDSGEEIIESFAILTVPANSLLSKIHNDKKRMPLILDDECLGDWISPRQNELSKIKPLLRPFDSNRMEAYRVSSFVNSGKNEGEECLKAEFDDLKLLESSEQASEGKLPTPTQGELF